jgi:sec-independent protein translocase protein TatA
VFNIGPPELIVILLVALLIVGPKRLPDVGKTIGRSLREFRKAQEDLKSSFNFDLDDEKASAKPSAPGSAKAPKTSQGDAPKEASEESRGDVGTTDGSSDDTAAIQAEAEATDLTDPPAPPSEG